MEDRIIQRIRENKRKIYKLYKLVKKNIDMEAEIERLLREKNGPKHGMFIYPMEFTRDVD